MILYKNINKIIKLNDINKIINYYNTNDIILKQSLYDNIKYKYLYTYKNTNLLIVFLKYFCNKHELIFLSKYLKYLKYKKSSYYNIVKNLILCGNYIFDLKYIRDLDLIELIKIYKKNNYPINYICDTDIISVVDEQLYKYGYVEESNDECLYIDNFIKSSNHYNTIKFSNIHTLSYIFSDDVDNKPISVSLYKLYFFIFYYILSSNNNNLDELNYNILDFYNSTKTKKNNYDNYDKYNYSYLYYFCYYLYSLNKYLLTKKIKSNNIFKLSSLVYKNLEIFNILLKIIINEKKSSFNIFLHQFKNMNKVVYEEINAIKILNIKHYFKDEYYDINIILFDNLFTFIKENLSKINNEENNNLCNDFYSLAKQLLNKKHKNKFENKLSDIIISTNVCNTFEFNSYG